MNLLYVVHDFFPRFYGGTERYVLNLSKQMQRMGHSVAVLTYGIEEPAESFSEDRGETFYKEYVYEGVRVISIRHRSIPADVGFVISDSIIEEAVERILSAQEFAVMHIAHPMRMASCYRVARRHGIPVVLTLTDFWLLCPRGRFFKPDFSLCNSPEEGAKCMRECGVNRSIAERYADARKMFEEIDTLVSPSRFLIGMFQANGWKRKIYHVKHGIDYTYVKPLPPAERDPRVVTFGYTGVVARFKGVDLLVKSFREVPSPGISLKIFGNYVWDKDFNSELDLAMEQDKRIQFMGKYEHDELAEVMSRLDVVVVPSTTLESYGLVVIESMAYGVPVIASDIVGSAYEFIKDGENGFVFPVGRPEALRDIIAAISDDHAVVDRLKRNIPLLPRIEEEAFMVESLYKQLVQSPGTRSVQAR